MLHNEMILPKHLIFYSGNLFFFAGVQKKNMQYDISCGRMLLDGNAAMLLTFSIIPITTEWRIK